MILLGIIYGEAAILDGLNAVQTQSYGPEARGGASKAEVIVADDEIDYPKVIQADLLLAMSQEACDQYGQQVKPGGWLILDENHVKRAPAHPRAVYVPITQISQETTGRKITANIVGLGLIVGLTDVVPREAVIQAVARRVPPGTKEINQRALEAGFELAVRLRGQYG